MPFIGNKIVNEVPFPSSLSTLYMAIVFLNYIVADR